MLVHMTFIAAMPWDWGWSPEAWAAIATWVTAGVAAGAAIGATRLTRRQVRYAHDQVEEAKRTRENQAQPFVSVDFEPSPASHIFMDLVIRNTGPTLATNVTFEFDKPLRSTLDQADGPSLGDVAILKRGIPTFPPGREYRMLFEKMPDLHETEELPREYTVTVRFSDMDQRSHELTYRLDLDIYWDWDRLLVYGEHDAAKALKEMNEQLKNRKLTTM